MTVMITGHSLEFFLVPFDNGQEFIQFTKGKEILVETAWRWEWERVLEYASS
jgi:hypothetical protein